MDKIFRQKRGLGIDETIYQQEFIDMVEEQAKEKESEVNFKANIRNMFESEKSTGFGFFNL